MFPKKEQGPCESGNFKKGGDAGVMLNALFLWNVARICIGENIPVGTQYCSDIGFLLDLHRDIDQLRIEIEVTSLYDIFFQHHNDVIAVM